VARPNPELGLLATKGSPMRVAKDVQQLIASPVGRHSEKPAEARASIERILTGPYLELFGRHKVKGWTVWGNEVDGRPDVALS
jgi:N6-adenosine-specific RNA methylase IME4